MEIKYYSIRGTLSRCSKSDFFDNNSKIIENATFYIKNESNYQFQDKYVIGSIYGHRHNSNDVDWEKISENYYLEQINYLISSKLIFKLSEVYNTLDYNFNLYLKTACESDIYYIGTNYLIFNKTYYCISHDNKILGPFTIHDNHSGDKFRDFLNKGSLLVPHEKQTFEPYKIAKAS